MDSNDRQPAGEERRTLSSFMTERPVAITMVFVAALVFGYFSYGRLAVTLMRWPDDVGLGAVPEHASLEMLRDYERQRLAPAMAAAV